MEFFKKTINKFLLQTKWEENIDKYATIQLKNTRLAFLKMLIVGINLRRIYFLHGVCFRNMEVKAVGLIIKMSEKRSDISFSLLHKI